MIYIAKKKTTLFETYSHSIISLTADTNSLLFVSEPKYNDTKISKEAKYINIKNMIQKYDLYSQKVETYDFQGVSPLAISF